MKEEEGTKIDWDYETGYLELMRNPPPPLQYDYEIPDDKIDIFDFLPTSDVNADVKFEELTSLSPLELEQQEVQVVKSEVTEPPCAAALAIEANIPTPNPGAISKWRTFISTAYYHPNILAHVDCADIKELFQLMGSDINFKSSNVMIDLGKTVKEYKPAPYLRPTLHSTQEPPIFNFAHVKDFDIDLELKVCIVKSYRINESMKKAVAEMVTFIVEYPEALYLEIYGFILDFLLKFGVQSEVIIDAVMRTQTRRRKFQIPGSVLILKKANRLGKGRKEFLQKRLLQTPEKKYHPVVPIISEPTPVRHLRNRRPRGGGEADTDRTPNFTCTPAYQTTSNLFLNRQQPTTEIEKTNLASSINNNSTLVFAVKRKLFVDNVEDDLKPKNINTSELRASSLAKDCHSSNKAQNVVLGRRKKRFYGRRDSNTIEKPFTCSICPDRGFAYKGNLVLHMKKKHSSVSSGKVKPKRQENEIPRFTCPVCLQGYASKYRCRTHMERHHPEHEGWEPISNEDTIAKLQKTVMKGKRKSNGNRISKGFVKNTRKSLAPLSEKQNSSLEQEKTSPFSLNSKSNYYSNNFESGKHANIEISKSVPANFNELHYSTLRHVRTRQQFRAAIK